LGRDRDETRDAQARDRDETETLSTLSETRPRRDVSTSRDRLETETSRPRPHPWCFTREMMFKGYSKSFTTTQFDRSSNSSVLFKHGKLFLPTLWGRPITLSKFWHSVLYQKL